MSLINNIIEIKKKRKIEKKEIIKDWNRFYYCIDLCFNISSEGKCPDSYEKCPVIFDYMFGVVLFCKHEISDYKEKDYKNIDLSRYKFLEIDDK